MSPWNHGLTHSLILLVGVKSEKRNVMATSMHPLLWIPSIFVGIAQNAVTMEPLATGKILSGTAVTVNATHTI